MSKMHFLGGVRKGIVAVVALLIIASNICICSIEASAAEGALTKEQEAFVEKFYDICVLNASARSLAWQTPMAQAIIESKSGTSDLAEKWHNFHGITAKGGYKHFKSDEEGWEGYFKNLENTPVYGENGIFENGEDPYEMLGILVKSGYAEAEDYVKVIGQYIHFIDNWREANNLPTSTEYAEKQQILETIKQQSSIAIKNLTPMGGCAGFSQMVKEIPTELPELNQETEDNKPNDPKTERERQEIAALSIPRKTYAIIPVWK